MEPIDPRLLDVIDVWDTLDEASKDVIYRLVMGMIDVESARRYLKRLNPS